MYIHTYIYICIYIHIYTLSGIDSIASFSGSKYLPFMYNHDKHF